MQTGYTPELGVERKKGCMYVIFARALVAYVKKRVHIPHASRERGWLKKATAPAWVQTLAADGMGRNLPSISFLNLILTLPFPPASTLFVLYPFLLYINITLFPSLLPQLSPPLPPFPNMMNPDQVLQSWLWPGCTFTDLDGLNNHARVPDFDFSSTLATTEDFSDDSYLPHYLNFNNSNVVTCPFSNYNHVLGVAEDQILPYDCNFFADCIDNDVYGMITMMEENSAKWLTGAGPLQIESPQEAAGSSSIGSTCSEELLLPGDDMDVDDQVAVLHLQVAHGEAVEMGLVKLAEVIVRRIVEKVGPLGTIMERVAHHLYQSGDDDSHREVEYLKLESAKNLDAAFRALYEACPLGRFAHLSANVAILEAMPKTPAAIHIVDFDTREGIQWPSMLEIFAQMPRNSPMRYRFTSMKWKDYNLKPTTKRLRDYARSVGLVLEVDEMDMEELRREMMKKREMMMRRSGGGGGDDWIMFNCMVGLPHMGLERRRRDAWEFLRLAKDQLMGTDHKGIVTFGCGDGKEMQAACSGGFGSYFEECMGHFHALFESMEWHFPPHLSLARTATECLFVGPYVSSHASRSMWEEMKEAGEMGLFQGGCRRSKNSLVEAKELVREGTTPYAVKLQGEHENEMVLEWKGSPLVRIYAWN